MKYFLKYSIVEKLVYKYLAYEHDSQFVKTFNKTVKNLLPVDGRDGVGEGKQDWGYVEVRKGAHMFWWLYYTTNQDVSSYLEKPLVIWLQGGPGGSSTGYGNFEEIGPYDVNLKPRDHTWVRPICLYALGSPAFAVVRIFLDNNSTSDYAITGKELQCSFHR